MTAKNKRAAKKIAKTGARTVGSIISLILKAIGSVLLIAITTGIIFTLIFVLYVKNNLSSNLDVNMDDFSVNLSSKIYYTDKATGEDKELVTLMSTEYRTWIAYEDIPIDMEHALVSIEDKRFYEHHGVDWYRTAAAFGNMFLSMKDNFGGSTITQQLIKNVTQEDEVTVQRKLQEIFRALEFEKTYSKEQIIEWYLNKVYFGGGRYGIAAAADYYFGKSLSELTVAECASIIGITNNPAKYSPYQDRKENKKRQEDILNAMYEQGYILTEPELKAAKSQALVFKHGENSASNTLIYSWFEEAVINDARDDLMRVKNINSATAMDLLLYGGYRIYATIDLSVQAKIDSIYQNLDEIPKASGSSQQFQSAIVIMDPDTGDIVGLSGGVGEKEANRLRSRATMMRRPPGSAFKPLAVYSIAMDLGKITPNTLFDDSTDVTLKGTSWYPHNYDREAGMGVVDVRNAVRLSLNTVPAQIIDIIGPDTSYRFLTEKLGFKLDPDDDNYAPLSLGQLTWGATVREMASAYTTFPNLGMRAEGRTYTKILDANGHVVYENPVKKNTAISPATAYWMNDLLLGVVRGGTGTEARFTGDLKDMAVAGKTGTTTDRKDRYFVGYTPYYVAAVWVGYDIPAAIGMNGNGATQLWKKVMTLVHEGLPAKQFDTPEDTKLTPAEWVKQVNYTILGVTDTGGSLYEVTTPGVLGKEINVTAQPVDGYEINGEGTQKLIIGENPDKNVVTFVYTSLAPPETASPEPSTTPDYIWTPPPATVPPETAPPEPSASPGGEASSPEPSAGVAVA